MRGFVDNGDFHFLRSLYVCYIFLTVIVKAKIITLYGGLASFPLTPKYMILNDS